MIQRVREFRGPTTLPSQYTEHHSGQLNGQPLLLLLLRDSDRNRTHHADSTGLKIVQRHLMLHVRRRQRTLRTAEELPAFPCVIKADSGSAALMTQFVTVPYLAFMGHLSPLNDDGIALREGKISYTVS